MKALRKLLYPFSILYGLITFVRNKCYDSGIFKSYDFDIPIISVGNLSVGGTGKTPHIEYLIRMLQTSKKIAVLSRGYQRKTSGFLIAKDGLNAFELGDEPFQYFSKFKDVIVAVDEKRVRGIQQLLKLTSPPDVILLDDAFQHRSVKPGLSIVLTPYDDLFVDDHMLPMGNLREYKSGSKRADIIIVTKCPNYLDSIECQNIKNKIKPTANQELFYSKITYQYNLQGFDNSININELHRYEVLLITGIANPKPLLNFLTQVNAKCTHLAFSDHHNFTSSDIINIKNTFSNLTSEKKIILTTEKDYVRIFASLEKCYFIAIETRIINNENIFIQKIKDYVG